MRRVIACFILVIILSCEWHDTLGSMFSSVQCCKAVCTNNDESCSQPNEPKEDGNCIPEGCNMLKNCSNCCCCYLLPPPIIFKTYSLNIKLTLPGQVELISTFTGECFHPPEIV